MAALDFGVLKKPSSASSCSHALGPGFVESFSAARLARELAPGQTSPRILDVGSGAGFPGLPARILIPEACLTLLEPRAKRAAFLRAVAAEYPSPAIAVRACRLEALDGGTQWDVVCFRAVRLRAAHVLRVLAPAGIVVGFPAQEPGENWLPGELEGAGMEPAGSRPCVPGERRVVTAWRRRSALQRD